MKGTWEGSGTFQTDGPDPGVVIAVLGVLLLLGGGGTAAAVASAITSLLVIVAIVVAVLVVVAAMVLFFLWRRTRRREAAYAVSERHQRIMAEVTAKPQVTRGAIPALEQHIHYHYHAVDGQEPVRVIPGKALP